MKIEGKRGCARSSGFALRSILCITKLKSAFTKDNRLHTTRQKSKVLTIIDFSTGSGLIRTFQYDFHPQMPLLLILRYSNTGTLAGQGCFII